MVLDESYEHLVGKEGSKLVWVDEIEYSALSQTVIDEYTEKGVPLLVKNCCRGMSRISSPTSLLFDNIT